MSQPNSRNDFKLFCLRKLGFPVIKINLDNDQIDDRIDEALEFYYLYHFDATQKQYFKHQVVQADIDNSFITLPPNIIGAVEIYPVNSSLATNSIFNIRYQIALNDLYSLTSVDMVPYFMAMQHIQFLEMMLVGIQPIRYNRHAQILYLDMDWGRIAVGEYLIITTYEIIDPNIYPHIWTDFWLQNYATAKIKQCWGEVLKKYKNLPMPGEIKFSGQEIYDEATKELEKLKRELIDTWSTPVSDFIG